MIDVVIVNWNSGHQIIDAIESVREFGSKLISRKIVVDNGSIDGSDKRLESFEDVELLRLERNHGFGRACNLGARLGQSEYILFFNPDAALKNSTLGSVIDFMQDKKNEKVGICGVQLLDELGHVARSCSRFPSALNFSARALGLERKWPILGNIMAEWDHSTVRDVDHVIGAFFLVRRGLFESLGGFDERFFLYLEDVDFSRRAHDAGFRSVYFADAQAFHSGGGTSAQVKARRLFYSLRSRLVYAAKHFSLFGLIWVALLTLTVEPLSRSVLAIARGSWRGLLETWSAYKLLWQWLPSWIFRGRTR